MPAPVFLAARLSACGVYLPSCLQYAVWNVMSIATKGYSLRLLRRVGAVAFPVEKVCESQCDQRVLLCAQNLVGHDSASQRDYGVEQSIPVTE